MSHKNQANILAKECMVTALMKLVQTKPLSAISISEITEYAGVSRMTYYRNYSSKEEIFKIYMDEIIQSLQRFHQLFNLCRHG
jgi:AcrR family transcriptional regulator